MDGQLVSQTGPGFLALIGVCNDDTPEHADILVKKILNLKLWPDGARAEQGALNKVDVETAKPWAVNVCELGGEILCGAYPH